jgi:hypothetical protein
MNGKVELLFLWKSPGELNYLFNEHHLQSKHPLDNACAFNNAFAFISVGAKVDISISRGGGPPVFKIQSALYYRHGHVLLGEDSSAKCAQIYFYDTQQQQVEHYMANNTITDTAGNVTLRLCEDVISAIQVLCFLWNLNILFLIDI